jgi:signal transduction histidine kinase
MVVASTGAEMGLDISNRPEIKRALAGRYAAVLRVRGYGYPKPSIESISRRSGYRVYSALPVINKDRVIGAVALVRTPMDTLKALYIRQTDLLVGGAFVFAAIIGISLLTSVFISRPIKAIGVNAKRIAEGAYNAPQDSKWPLTQETKELSTTFNIMVDSLEKRANYFRSFAYNVSHELKTPLTSMTGSVELLQDHMDSMDDGEKRRFLAIIKGDLSRLERLMTKLLELARADTVRPEASQIDVVPVISHIVERFRKRGLKVEHTSVEGAILAPIAEEALDSIVSNLLENSWRHGGPGVTASISLRRTRLGEDYFLVIETRDNGPGISDFHRERIFDRFYTTSKESGGTGLGLSIVKTIVEAHEGTIELAASPKGPLFIITLPAKPRK